MKLFTKIISLYSIIALFSLFTEFKCESDDELAINFLPSEMYKLNKKDLMNLRTERQVKR